MGKVAPSNVLDILNDFAWPAKCNASLIRPVWQLMVNYEFGCVEWQGMAVAIGSSALGC